MNCHLMSLAHLLIIFGEIMTSIMSSGCGSFPGPGEGSVIRDRPPGVHAGHFHSIHFHFLI